MALASSVMRCRRASNRVAAPEKVKAIICLGLDNQKIIQTFSNVVDLIVETAGAEEAVKVAYKIAEKGDSVLLSPACASFDLFENYEDRGNKFKEAVSAL